MQDYTIVRYYQGLERFTVEANSPEEALEKLNKYGSGSNGVSERESDEYLSVEKDEVYDDDELVLSDPPSLLTIR